jgi:hypothetical protein
MNFKHLMKRYMEEADATGGSGGAAVTGGDTGAATTQAAAPDSILANGAGDITPSANDFIPEKLRVIKEDGSFDLEASSRKVAEAYGNLEKRFGAGDVPPKEASEYKVTVPDALKEAFDPATDEGTQDFLSKAHAAGFTQAQIDLVMDRYFDMAPKLVAGALQHDVATATAELQKTWTTDADLKRNVKNAYIGANAAAQKAGLDINAVMSSGLENNPTFLRLMAALGPEFQEDPGAGNATMVNEEDINSLMASEAYTNQRHADHAKVSKKIATYFERKYGNEAAA